MAAAVSVLGTSEKVPDIVRQVIGNERYLEMDRRRSYLEGTMHDTKRYDFDGRPISPGPVYYGSWLSSEKMPGVTIPLRARRPCMPMRLGRTIITSFTDLVFGEGRDPTISAPGDELATDCAKTIFETAGMPSRMIQARDLGGAMGTVGLSWAIVNGRPKVRVHAAGGLRVAEWEDRDDLVPSVVEEVRLFYRDELDPTAGRVVRRAFWRRKTWTPDADIVYQEVSASGADQRWIVDPKLSSYHGDGVTHFAWIQNIPSDDEDGYADLAGMWEQCDEADAIYSVISRGAKANLDPTLKLKVNPAEVQIMGVRKGSDQAIVVGATGDASYLELSGQSIAAGLSLSDSQRRTVLEGSRCVIPDPSSIAAQGVSSLAIKMIFAPMIGRGAILREQYGAGIKRVLDGILTVSRKRMSQPVEVVDPATGERRPGKFVLRLPPRLVEASEEPGDDGAKELGEEAKKMVPVPRDPGKDGSEVALAWPKWFPPTAADLQSESTTLTTATGAKAVVSQRSAVEAFAASLGNDPREEWQRVQAEADQAKAEQAEMFQGSGNPPPSAAPGAPPPHPAAPPQQPAPEPHPFPGKPAGNASAANGG